MKLQLTTITEILLGQVVSILKDAFPSRGRSWACQLTLKVNAPVTKIFFHIGYESENIPPGQVVAIPRKALKKLIILNEGNADLAFCTNREPNDVRLTSILRNNEDRQFDSDRNDYHSIFLQAIPPGGPNPFDPNVWQQTNPTPPPWNGDVTTAHIRIETED